jgi:membrane protein required for colicin V production
MTGLNFVDIIILIIFGVSALVGLKRGLVSEVVSLATLIAAFVIAILFSNSLATYFTSSSSVQEVVSSTSNAIGTNTAQPVSYIALGVSFGLLFAGTSLIGMLIKSLLNIAVQAGMLGIGNRLLGAIFGLARGFLINLVLIFVVQLSSFGNSPWWHQSQWVQSFQPAVVWLGSVVSPSLTQLKSKFQETVQGMGAQIQNLTH